MDKGSPYADGKKIQFEKFHIWETAIWLKATNREIVKNKQENYELKKVNNIKPTDIIIENSLRPCLLTEIRDDGRFQFEYTSNPTNVRIYYRPDIDENEKVMNEVIPELYISYKLPKHIAQ
jgi:hypothetical protein